MGLEKVKSGPLGLPAIKQKQIAHYCCLSCEREVKRMEMEIPMGPDKGKKIINNQGCKCKDKPLAQQALQQRAQLVSDKMKSNFDYYSLINKSLHKATFANYQPTSKELQDAMLQIREYAKTFSQDSGNLVITGSYGTGKSHLSVSVTKIVMSMGKSALFVSFPKLLTKIRSTYNNGGITEDELLQKIQSVDLLVLDDIGAEQSKKVNEKDHVSWAQSKLFEIIDDRAGKPTIYTTNLDSEGLLDNVGERNMSRMMEDTQVIKMNGQDYRRKGF
ncbi:ATP-binding protein [Terribacillus saccharophilus]|uniref:ATP-binding protein n=1 Tax=Terribacillus saccharophilus TaxID=361277 RepID=UPI000BA6E27A|nr:ATP-binding protein [Terribacillus saccharophilus]PAF19726.1 DnaC replication protein [Terribacillus saccharophilus]